MLACGDGARMRQPVWEYARARAAPGASVAGLSTYQLTLFGLQPSAIINGVFNLLAAASLALLGHPLAAAVAFVTYCGIDIVNHRVVRRLLAASEGVGPKEGSRKLVAICAARVSVYLAPTVAEPLIFEDGGPTGGKAARITDKSGFVVAQWAKVAIVTNALSSIFALVAFHHLAGLHQSVEQGNQLAAAFRQFILDAPRQAPVIIAHD